LPYSRTRADDYRYAAVETKEFFVVHNRIAGRPLRSGPCALPNYSCAFQRH
jgi:hypothetical protein